MGRVHQAYLHVAPHPEHWRRLVAKIEEFDRSVEDWSREELVALQDPALLIFLL